jgi:molecular chaperone Hsp33
MESQALSGEEPIGSKWIKCMSTAGNVRGVSIQATELVRSIAQMHGLKGDSAKALAETLMGALLVASYCKGGDRINLNIQGSGRIKQALADAYPDGAVRGYVIEREGKLPKEISEEIGPWGEGLLSILRTQGAEHEQPYIGTVPLLTGHLAKDLTFYWVQSEQIPSAVGLAVRMEGDQIAAAGGFLVQVLPGASAEEVKAIEHHIQEINSLAEEVSKHKDPVYLLSQIFQNSPFILVEERPLVFRCNCSWDRVNRALTLVGVAELNAILTENGSASVRCDFCTQEYNVDGEGLKALIKTASGQV